MTRGLATSLNYYPLMLTSAETTAESLGKVLNAWTQVLTPSVLIRGLCWYLFIYLEHP